jgi:hypothetical protein
MDLEEVVSCGDAMLRKVDDRGIGKPLTVALLPEKKLQRQLCRLNMQSDDGNWEGVKEVINDMCGIIWLL